MLHKYYLYSLFYVTLVATTGACASQVQVVNQTQRLSEILQGFRENLTTLVYQDAPDAAFEDLLKRIPTSDEFQELRKEITGLLRFSPHQASLTTEQEAVLKHIENQYGDALRALCLTNFEQLLQEIKKEASAAPHQSSFKQELAMWETKVTSFIERNFRTQSKIVMDFRFKKHANPKKPGKKNPVSTETMPAQSQKPCSPQSDTTKVDVAATLSHVQLAFLNTSPKSPLQAASEPSSSTSLSSSSATSEQVDTHRLTAHELVKRDKLDKLQRLYEEDIRFAALLSRNYKSHLKQVVEAKLKETNRERIARYEALEKQYEQAIQKSAPKVVAKALQKSKPTAQPEFNANAERPSLAATVQESETTRVNQPRQHINAIFADFDAKAESSVAPKDAESETTKVYKPYRAIGTLFTQHDEQ